MERAIGLMSGTSMDGIDAALIESDGDGRVTPGASLSFAYEPAFRERLRAVMGGKGPVGEVEEDLTRRHAAAVAALLEEAGVVASDIRAIGFHGQTILHEPDRQRTWQIGDGALLARLTAIDVVNDFRSADMAAGGQGAPLAPLYHAARAEGLERPIAVLNVGGVANVTWIGSDESILAFDTGPGNAMIDDWVACHGGGARDEGGRLAKAGRVDESALARLMADPYFDRPAPKSLDRQAFDAGSVENLSLEDGAASLTAFTAAAVARAQSLMPQPPARWLVCGGGRHNAAIMAALRERLPAPVEAVEAVGWNGDMLEAEAFAYLALRSLKGLPLSLPGTTGVARPTTGGRLHSAL